MTQYYPLTTPQITALVEILDDPAVEDLMAVNNWYRQFVPSIRIDVIRLRVISERQLYQVRKLAELTNQQWRIIV